MSDRNIIIYIIILCLLIIFGYYYKKGKNKLTEGMRIGDFAESSVWNVGLAPHVSALGIPVGNHDTALMGTMNNYINFDGTAFLLEQRSQNLGPQKWGLANVITGIDFGFPPRPSISGQLSKFGDLLKPWIGGMMAVKKKARNVAKAGWDFDQCKQIYTDRCKGEVVIINKNTTVEVVGGKRCVRNTKDKKTMSSCITPEEYCSRGFKTPVQKEGCQPALKSYGSAKCTYYPSPNPIPPLPYQLRQNYSENYHFLPKDLQEKYDNAVRFKCSGSAKVCDLVNKNYHNLCVGEKMKEKVYLENMPRSIEKNKYRACQWISDFKGVSPENWGWGVVNENDKCIWEFNRCKTKRLKNPSCQEISDIYLVGSKFNKQTNSYEMDGYQVGHIPKKMKDIWKNKQCKTVPPPIPPPDKLNFFPGCQWIADNRGPSEGTWKSTDKLPRGVKVGDAKPPKNTFGLVREWWHLNCGTKNPKPKKEDHIYVKSLSLDNKDDKKSIVKKEEKFESPWILKQKKYSLLDSELSKLPVNNKTLVVSECQKLSEKYGIYNGNWGLLYQPSDPTGELARGRNRWLSLNCNTKPSKLAKENVCQQISNTYGVYPGNWGKLWGWWTNRNSPKWNLAYNWIYGTGDNTKYIPCQTKTGGKLKPNPLLATNATGKLSKDVEDTISCQYISDYYNVYGNDWLQHSNFNKIPSSIKEYWKKNKCTTKPSNICQSLADNYGTTSKVFDEKTTDINQIKNPQQQCQWISNYKGVYPGNWGYLWVRPTGLLPTGTPDNNLNYKLRSIWAKNRCTTKKTAECQKDKKCSITQIDYGDLKDIQKQQDWVSEKCTDKKTQPLPLLKNDLANLRRSIETLKNYYGNDHTQVPVFGGKILQNPRKFHKDNF